MTTDLKVTGPLNGEGLYTPSAEQSKALDKAEIGTSGFTSFVNHCLPNAAEHIGPSAEDTVFLQALDACRGYEERLRAEDSVHLTHTDGELMDMRVTGGFDGPVLWTASAEQSKALDNAELGTLGFTSYVNRTLPSAADYIGSSADCPNFLAALTLCRAYVDELRAARGDS